MAGSFLSRWFQFRLRTLFALMTLAAIPLAWAAYSLDWIEQRHQRARWDFGMPDDDPDRWYVCVFDSYQYYMRSPYAPRVRSATTHAPPSGLWLFGESGMNSIFYVGPPNHLEDAQRLFPEAHLQGSLIATSTTPTRDSQP